MPENVNDSIHFRLLSEMDLSFCDRLIQQAGWNQNKNDWIRMINLDPEGCFVVERESNKVATIVFTRFDKVTWVSMVLVDKAYRGQGIGQEMFQYILKILVEKNIETVRLDATGIGIHLYRKFGFNEEYDLIRFVKKNHFSKEDCSYKSIETELINSISKFDRNVTQTNRSKLISALCYNSNPVCIETENSGDIRGYITMRSGRSGIQLGPCIASDPNVGLKLLDRGLKMARSNKVIIDIPVSNEAAISWSKRNDFTEERRFTRMYSGKKIYDEPSMIFASFGPEKG